MLNVSEYAVSIPMIMHVAVNFAMIIALRETGKVCTIRLQPDFRSASIVLRTKDENRLIQR